MISKGEILFQKSVSYLLSEKIYPQIVMIDNVHDNNNKIFYLEPRYIPLSLIIIYEFITSYDKDPN